MLQLVSYFEGHGGAITALAKGDDEQSFFSSGAEGLIVKWQLSAPNEGEVIVKLGGLISSIAYNAAEQLIYSTVNHTGLFVIDANKRKVINFIKLPGVSFKQLALSNNHIITSTHFGELLVLDKKSLKMRTRLDTGLASFVNFVVKDDVVWYSSKKGIMELKIDGMGEKEIYLAQNANCFSVNNNLLFFLSPKAIGVYNLLKNKIVFDQVVSKNGVLEKMMVESASANLVLFYKPNAMEIFKIGKKSIKLLKNIQINHIGGINDILSLENHKFVITAGIDKKIGVWQLH